MLNLLKGTLALATFVIYFQGIEARATEPAYCSYDAFMKLEVRPSVQGLERAHIFKLGNIYLAGLGVGSSPYRAVESLAQEFSSTSSTEGYCTWYLNQGNDDAAQDFNHRYLSKPSSDPAKAADEYLKKLQPFFGEAKVNFLSCVEARGYLAVGCNDQKHRGPSAFGMILAYSGCTPEHSLNIVDRLWGLNGVKAASRLAIITSGANLGNGEPDQRTRLQNHFLGRAR